MTSVSVVGGGFAGLVAAIECAEAGASVTLYEAHQRLGGRARATEAPYVAHDGPHVLYADGPWWAWLARRGLVSRSVGVPLKGLTGLAFRLGGRLRRTPPLPLLRVLADRRRPAPDSVDFGTWIAERHGATAARLAANAAGVFTFDADPGRLSAAFVAERLRRAFAVPPPARYVLGGWTDLVDRIAAYARTRGVAIETGTRIAKLPRPPVIVATSIEAAGRLLPIDEPAPPSGHAMLLDLAVHRRRGDAFVISDLDEAGWLENYSLPDPALAPPGESLIQAQVPIRPGESRAAALARVEALADLGVPGWRDRLTWRRDAVANGRSGALDLPGRTWRDRPAVERGDGVFLAGDRVAAPGLLSEVSFHSARQAAAAVRNLTTAAR
jgi:phytoene dehydrogenase-like protein